MNTDTVFVNKARQVESHTKQSGKNHETPLSVKDDIVSCRAMQELKTETSEPALFSLVRQLVKNLVNIFFVMTLDSSQKSANKPAAAYTFRSGQLDHTSFSLEIYLFFCWLSERNRVFFVHFV